MFNLRQRPKLLRKKIYITTSELGRWFRIIERNIRKQSTIKVIFRDTQHYVLTVHADTPAAVSKANFKYVRCRGKTHLLKNYFQKNYLAFCKCCTVNHIVTFWTAFTVCFYWITEDSESREKPKINPGINSKAKMITTFCFLLPLQEVNN